MHLEKSVLLFLQYALTVHLYIQKNQTLSMNSGVFFRNKLTFIPNALIQTDAVKLL